MKREELSIISVMGETLSWRIWTPEETAIRGVVQLVHGMAEHIDRYEETARALTDAGFAVSGHTHAGHGLNTKNPGWFGEKNGWQNLIDDVHAVRMQTAERFPGVPYFILGHSMGSFIVRCYLTQHADGLTGAVISGTGDFPNIVAGAGLTVANLVCLLGGARKPSKLINDIAFASNNKPFEPARTPFDWLSRDTVQVDRYVADPACGFLFTGAGYRDLFRGLLCMNDQAAMKKIPLQLPLLFISGDHDPVGGMGKGVNAVAQRMRDNGLEHIDVRLYKDGRHEMFNETNCADVWRDLARWLKAQLGE